MSPAQARRMLRSLLYRSRLADELPAIEAELIAYVQAQGPQVISGLRGQSVTPWSARRGRY